ncbi:GGDEF domain-containing protein [Actinoplanes sp. NPDC051346]|uniref:GGDEF domain-containing protein n=1 Tax=Actinoplanes sp. NPDC051346 TaxID=3155048 RepID=UPI00341DAC86
MSDAASSGQAVAATALDAIALDAEIDALAEQAGIDVEVALPRVAMLEQLAADLGDSVLRWRCTVLRADLVERRGDLIESMKLAWEAHAWATAAGCNRVLSRAHEMLGRAFRNMGDLVANLEHRIQSVDALDDTTPPTVTVKSLIKLADAFAETESLTAARERYEEAFRMAEDLGDLRLQAMVFNNWAYREYEHGDAHLARQVLDRLVALSEVQGWELDYCDLDTIARVELRLRHYLEAETAALAALESYRTGDHSESDAEPDLLLTLAAVQRHRGALEEAQESLTASKILSDAAHIDRLTVKNLLEQAQLYAASGDFESAFHTMCEQRAVEKAQLNQEREAQARNRQALFEVDEARRQAEAFRDQARRDPLTGLRNRRFVDEALPSLLKDVAAEGAQVTTALLDLDYFKRINDTLSHEVGDRVLAECATLLAQVPVGDRGMVARVGGEEFLLVITGVHLSAAVFILEDLRRTVAEHDWKPITGDLPVTVSVGVTSATAESTQSTLLSRADEALYEAKREGRNRVCLDSRSELTSRRLLRNDIP